jgi:hypothetical protein
VQADTEKGIAIMDQNVTTFTDLGREMWSYLTGKEAVINYKLEDMTIDVPSATGPDAPSARWRVNGTLSISTSDRDQRTAASS